MQIYRVLAACAAILAPSSALAAPAAELSTAIDYEEGEYGTGESVESNSALVGVRLESGRLFLFGSLPYQRLEAPANVVAGGGLLGLPIIIDPTQPTTRQVREGLGDLRVGGGYRLGRVAGIEGAISAELKVPTASARRGLGTGEMDVTIGGEVSRTIGSVAPFVAASYTLPGDPAGYRLRESLAARAGIAARFGSAVSGSLAYGYAQSLSPLVPHEEQLSAGFEIGVSRHLSLGLQGSAGLSEGAANVAAGVRLGWRVF